LNWEQNEENGLLGQLSYSHRTRRFPAASPASANG
jgi:hypothetical protein